MIRLNLVNKRVLTTTFTKSSLGCIFYNNALLFLLVNVFYLFLQNSCDIVKGVPSGLTEFIAPLQRAGLCVMTPQPTSLGFWTIYMESFGSGGANNTAGSPNPSEISYNPEQQPHPAQMQHLQQMQHQRHLNGPPVPPQGGQQQQPEPEIQAIRLKKANGGMGLSIVAAKGIGKDKLGIYVKAVVDNGAAYHDGRLEPGDQVCLH